MWYCQYQKIWFHTETLCRTYAARTHILNYKQIEMLFEWIMRLFCLKTIYLQLYQDAGHLPGYQRHDERVQ